MHSARTRNVNWDSEWMNEERELKKCTVDQLSELENDIKALTTIKIYDVSANFVLCVFAGDDDR